jgi:glycosyltransferase involved in cell wall biosynthesis
MEEVNPVNPKLSIITINLNDASGLEETIRSIVNQTYTNFELIVIDGGSEDGSRDVIKRYSDGITYWKSEPDKGIYNAMNKGISHAKGEYCFFLNSGDYLVSEDVLNSIFAETVNEDIVYGNLLVYENGRRKIKRSYGKAKLTFLDIYLSSIKHQSSFIKRTLFDKYGYYDEEVKILADWAFFLKTVGLGEATTKYLDIDISYFDDNGISNDASQSAIDDRIAQRTKVLNEYLPSRIRDDYEDFATFEKYRKLMKYKFSVYFLKALYKGVNIFEKLFWI